MFQLSWSFVCLKSDYNAGPTAVITLLMCSSSYFECGQYEKGKTSEILLDTWHSYMCTNLGLQFHVPESSWIELAKDFCFNLEMLQNWRQIVIHQQCFMVIISLAVENCIFLCLPSESNGDKNSIWSAQSSISFVSWLWLQRLPLLIFEIWEYNKNLQPMASVFYRANITRNF